MKNSEIYYLAMLSVIEDCRLESCTKLKIIDKLIDDKRLEEFREQNEGEQKDVQ